MFLTALRDGKVKKQQTQENKAVAVAGETVLAGRPKGLPAVMCLRKRINNGEEFSAGQSGWWLQLAPEAREEGSWICVFSGKPLIAWLGQARTLCSRWGW